ncbi:unnamed protein product, partial [Schistosoma curassoni]|uniref:Peptidase M12A domain-containing protein n=1 Tax=Schistosoma curassoni TaxID=6186 RepID=A0A183L6F0_9TREM
MRPIELYWIIWVYWYIFLIEYQIPLIDNGWKSIGHKEMEEDIPKSTWNVRTMWDTERAFQIAAEMRRYNLEVIGISETHWTQAGQQRLASGELLLYSGHEEENSPHTQGIVLVLSKQAQNALIGWESHGPRIIKASFKTKKEGISMN